MPTQGVLRITTPDGQVKEYDVDFDSAIVGRADGNRIVIPHVTVSRRHAHLTFDDGKLMVEDFASATGTFIDGRQVQPGERLEIPPGSDVRFGEAHALYIAPEVVAPPPPPEPVVPVEAPPAATIAPPVASTAAPAPAAPPPEPVIEYSPPPTPPPARPAPPAPPPAAAQPPPRRPITHEQPAPSSASGAMAAQGEAQQRQFIGVNLASPPLAVLPGQSAAATVALQNRGNVVDEFAVSVADVPPDWVQIARPRVQLVPGARDEITIVFRPGEGANGAAGPHRFTVIVESREHGIDVRSIGQLTVSPVEKIEAVMRPLKGRGDYTIEVTNRGNTVVPLVIEGRDDENALEISLADQEPLQPGEVRTIKVDVEPRKKKKFGRESSTPFRVAVRSGQSSAPPIRLDGSNAYKPPLERWKAPVAGILLLMGISGGSYGVYNQCMRTTGVCAELLGRTKDNAVTPDRTATVAAVSPTTAGATTDAGTPEAPTAPPADPNCPSTRLQPGMEAVLINSGSPKTRVRSAPSRSADIYGEVGDGFKVTTIRCQKAEGEDLIFWEVALSEPVGGVTSGWIAEQDPTSKQFLLSPAP